MSTNLNNIPNFHEIIKITQSDDTQFLESKLLEVSIHTPLDLDGGKVVGKLGLNKFTYDIEKVIDEDEQPILDENDFNVYKFQIDFTKFVTCTLEVGIHNLLLKVVHLGKIWSLKNIDFEIMGDDFVDDFNPEQTLYTLDVDFPLVESIDVPRPELPTLGKGNDTDFFGEPWTVISFASLLPLDNYKVQVNVDNIPPLRELYEIHDDTVELSFKKSQTEPLTLGTHILNVKVVDGEKRVHNSGNFEFEVVDTPFVPTTWEFEIELQPQGISKYKDYNELKNLPTIEGVEVKGELTLNDFGVSDYINNAVESHNTNELAHTDIREQMGVLEGQIGNFEQNITNTLNTKIDSLGSQVDLKVQNLDTKLSEQIQFTQRDLNELDVNFSNKSTQLDTSIESLDTKINDVQTNLQTSIDGVESNLMQLQSYTSTQLGVLGNEVNLKASTSALDEFIESTDEKFENTNKDIENLGTQIDSKLADKQDKLVAGKNIIIEGNVISSTGGGGGGQTDIGLSIIDGILHVTYEE